MPSIKEHLKKVLPAFLIGLVLAEGVLFYSHYTYGYHVEQAWNQMDKLEEVLKTPSKPALFLAALLGNDEEDPGLNETELSNITAKLVNLTEHAIENADELTDTKELKKAIGEIRKLQKAELELIAQALEQVETKPAVEAVEANYTKSSELQAKVEEAYHQVQLAIADRQTTMALDIPTEKDEEAHGNQHGQNKPAYHPPAHTNTPAPSSAQNKQHKNPNAERLEEQKRKDAEQREANRQRIMLIQQAHK